MYNDKMGGVLTGHYGLYVQSVFMCEMCLKHTCKPSMSSMHAIECMQLNACIALLCSIVVTHTHAAKMYAARVQ